MSPAVMVIGAGPAGLMAAETLARAGHRVAVYDAMRSVGRKFLLAGIGGLNLTHSEAPPRFIGRYGERSAWLQPMIDAFGPQALRNWAAALGVETFIGSSGRVFPAHMKAAPLLRAWLHELRNLGVSFHMRQVWRGWDSGGRLLFEGEQGVLRMPMPRALVLALGGASWPRLGSDGTWVGALRERGVEVAGWRAANCGFDVGWSPRFAARFAGHALKPVVLSCRMVDGQPWQQQGELVVTTDGVEGSLVYAAAAGLRDAIELDGAVDIELDLMPGWSEARLEQALSRPRGHRSLANHWRSTVGLEGVKANLLREQWLRGQNVRDGPRRDPGPDVNSASGGRQDGNRTCDRPDDNRMGGNRANDRTGDASPVDGRSTSSGADALADPVRTARLLKALPIRLVAPRPVAEAISSAGGVRPEALDDRLMLNRLPGIFCAGEMLDWEAPTGGYLLTACFATGHWAGREAALYLSNSESKD